MDAPELLTRLFKLEHDLDIVDGIAGPSQGEHAVPRATLYQHAAGHSLILSADLPQRARDAVRQLDPAQALANLDLIREILASDAPCDVVFQRVVHVFRCAPDVMGRTVIRSDKGWAIEIDGEIASEAWSAAENDAAASVRVDTLPAFRRLGLAGSVVAAWAHEMLASGKTPYYTHAIDNPGSEALALKLGAVELARGAKFH